MNAPQTPYITRGELHAFVWQHQLAPLAIALGVPIQHIREACLKHKIPKPHGSHWQKVAVGRPPKPRPLSGNPADLVYGIPRPAGPVPAAKEAAALLLESDHEVAFRFVRERLRQASYDPNVLELTWDGRPSVLLRRVSMELAAAVVHVLRGALKRRRLDLRLSEAGCLCVEHAARRVVVQVLDPYADEISREGREWRLSDYPPVVRVVLAGLAGAGNPIWTFRHDHQSNRTRAARVAATIAMALESWRGQEARTAALESDDTGSPDASQQNCDRGGWDAQAIATGDSERLDHGGFFPGRVPLQPERLLDAREAATLVREAEAWRHAQLLREYARHLRAMAGRGASVVCDPGSAVAELEAVADRIDPTRRRLGAF